MALLVRALVRYSTSYLRVSTTASHERRPFELAFSHTRRWILTASVRTFALLCIRAPTPAQDLVNLPHHGHYQVDNGRFRALGFYISCKSAKSETLCPVVLAVSCFDCNLYSGSLKTTSGTNKETMILRGILLFLSFVQSSRPCCYFTIAPMQGSWQDFNTNHSLLRVI